MTSDRRPQSGGALPALGSRLWLYTNVDCNPSCDYCCAESADERAAVTILTNAMLLSHGSRRRTLAGLDPGSATMQVSLDSASAGLHDAHRGATMNAGGADRATALQAFRCT